MEKLVVERSIEIDATPAAVWRLLTGRTNEWSSMFGASGPIESDWRLGSPVNWRNAQGQVYVSGRVTAVEPEKLLRFSVRGVTPDRQPTSGLEADDLTQSYSLATKGSRTVLSTAHGDFAVLADGAQVFPRVGELWDELLPLLKKLAESE